MRFVRAFFAEAPGAVWAAVIAGLTLLAEWLGKYYGDTYTWVPPVAGLLLTVIVPVLRIALGQTQQQTTNTRAVAPERPLVNRFLW